VVLFTRDRYRGNYTAELKIRVKILK